MDLKEILEHNIAARQQEVAEYEFNNVNFRMAIESIGEDKTMADFKSHLKQLLAESTHEQLKAQIMLDVVSSRLNALEN